ncbi:MAG: hypothetical protein V2J62_02165 [candidate division KSB1 bacterium]|nr:hypothetical protein [candidate division KSB1 bacterium]
MKLIDEIKGIDNSNAKLKRFGLTIGLVLILFCIGFLVFRGRFYIVLLIAGLILVLLGMVQPKWLKYLNWIWMAMALMIGLVMNMLILGLLFYLVFTSIGLTARLFGKRFLETGWLPERESYWNKREKKGVLTSDIEKQY